MHYSDVAKRYYDDTKNRILENVLAAEEYSGSSQADTDGEREKKEKNIMVSTKTSSATRIRGGKGIIAAACALVMIGSGAVVMHGLKEAVEPATSSRPDRLMEMSVTSSDEDMTSDSQDHEADEEDTKEKNTTEVKEKTSAEEEKKTDSRQTANSTVTSADGEDSSREEKPAANNESSTANESRAVSYELDGDNFVNDDILNEVNEAAFICGGTITSKDIYGRTASNDFRPLSEYADPTVVTRLYFRCTLDLDGTCFKGSEVFSYLPQTREYDAATGDMELIIPIGKKQTEDMGDFAGNYAEDVNQIDNIDLYNVGDKMLVEYYIDGTEIHAQDYYRYDPDDKIYHNTSYYVPSLREEYSSQENMTNYLLNTFKGGSPETAEQWVGSLGESSVIRSIPSKRFSSGQVVSVNYSLNDNCYVIYTAE